MNLFFNIARGVFCMVLNILCFHAFSTTIGLFSQDVLFKILNGRNLFPETFFKDFFPQDFFSAKIQDFISENFFSENFFGGYLLCPYRIKSSGLRVNFIFETLIKVMVGRGAGSRHIRIDFTIYKPKVFFMIA